MFQIRNSLISAQTLGVFCLIIYKVHCFDPCGHAWLRVFKWNLALFMRTCFYTVIPPLQFSENWSDAESAVVAWTLEIFNLQNALVLKIFGIWEVWFYLYHKLERNQCCFVFFFFVVFFLFMSHLLYHKTGSLEMSFQWNWSIFWALIELNT